jgi:quercetin dioxygenase-like cupin family protein
MVFTDATSLNVPIGNVTFAPGTQNNWKSHKMEQILLATGWYQAEGKATHHSKQEM